MNRKGEPSIKKTRSSEMRSAGNNNLKTDILFIDIWKVGSEEEIRMSIEYIQEKVL